MYDMMKKRLFPPLYDHIVDLLRPYRAYLVGGAVRDLLLKRRIFDLDFALPKDTVKVAKMIADQLGGGFFILDPERETCRVILKDEEDRQLVVDFTLFQGNTIEEDLSSRDFTITSMALDLGEDSRLIDPFQGTQDLQEGLIRATSERSLEDDPLRCLRAVRLASQLGFYILPETKEQISRYHHRLAEVSPERKRDELFRILAGPNQSPALLSLQMLDLYAYLLPGELSQRQSRVIRNLEILWTTFLQDHDQDKAGSWSRGLLAHRLGRYRDQARELINWEMVPGRSIYQLGFIIPLLSGLSGSDHELTSGWILDHILLSNQEANFIVKGIQSTVNWQSLTQNKMTNQAVDVHRFFTKYGRAGVVAIFLTLGEILDVRSGGKDQDHWIEQLEQARFFLEGYWERYQEWVDPPSLLDGNDIQVELGIPPGPEIGLLLELLREEQVRSGLSTKEKGLEFLKTQLPLSNGRGS